MNHGTWKSITTQPKNNTARRILFENLTLKIKYIGNMINTDL